MTYQQLIRVLKVPHGKVKQEDNMRESLKLTIPELKEDAHGNLYLINPGTPLFCSHMDNVGSKEAQLHLDKIDMNDLGIIQGTHNMGADDKVGIYICLQMYKKFGNRISLLFTIQEEVGGLGAEAFDKKLLETNTYCVIPDRFGTSDVISSGNDYCTQEFENAVMKELGKYGFAPAQGVWCDADVLNEYINCINISCGYYKHHSDQERISWKAVENTINALEELVEANLPRMEPPVIQPTFSRYDLYPDQYLSAPSGGCLVNSRTGQTIEIPKGEWEFTEYPTEVEDQFGYYG